MFRIEFSSRAKRNFDILVDLRAKEILENLSNNPVPAKLYDVKKLRGFVDTFRVRIGKIRIVYKIFWEEKAILIFKVGERESVYD